MSLVTIVDYIVATYGCDQLASLIAVSVWYDSLDALAPEVFGVSVTDFEQGWRTM